MKGGSGRAKDSRESWLFLAINGCITSCADGPQENFGILVVIFVEYFNETNTKIGWVGSVLLFSTCCSYPVAVSLCRRVGFRPMVVTSAILVSIGFITTPLVPSANYFFFTYSIPIGSALGFIDCLTIAILPEYFDKFLGLATGIRYACTAAGSMVFGFIFPALIESIGWKKTFFCFSSIGPVLVFIAICYRKPTISTYCEVDAEKESDIKETNEENQPMAIRRGFQKDRGFQLIVIGCFPFFCVVAVPLMFMVQYAKSLGYPLSQSKWLLIARNMGSLIGRITMGCIGDFASRRGVITYIACAVIIIFGVAAGLCSLTQHLPLMILHMTVNGLLEGMFWVIVPLMMNEQTGGINADYAFSLLYMLVGVGFLIGPSSMGWVYDSTGDFRNVLYVICVCSLVGGVTVAFGIYIKSRQRFDRNRSCDSELPLTKDDSSRTKINGIKSLSIVARIERGIKLELEKKAIVQYETTV